MNKIETAKHQEFCIWACNNDFKNVKNSKGEITPDGKLFIKILKDDPDHIRNVLRKQIHGMIQRYVVLECKNIFFNTEELCNDLLEILKKRFLSAEA